MTEQQPDWYSLMRDAPLKTKTFTMRNIERIEQRVAETRRGSKNGMIIIAAIAAASALAVIITVFALSISSAPIQVVKSTAQPPIASQTETQQPADTLNEHPYKLKGQVGAVEKPDFIYGAMPPKFMADPNQDYKITAADGEFVQIVPVVAPDQAHTGWVPRWYLLLDSSEGAVRIKDVPTYEMIVNTRVFFRLYPDQPKPSGFELEPGKVVQVTGQFEQWVRVNIITYDSPNNGDKWVPKSALTDWDPSKAREGFLRPGAKIYDEQGNAIGDVPGNNPIQINPVYSGNRYPMSSAGGFSGYINNKDFVPNPFRYDNGKFPKNANGQTYGSASDASTPETEPDLIRAYGVDGTVGYVLKKDLDGEMPKTPEEALAMQKNRHPGGRDIPLYDVDGQTVIGVFHIDG
ncbi:hypothetical protein E5161_16875 [Cohnella pontilimi]|uniref:Uncharacterized protein n=1 Tax=Cohnella pontilimi TaxID=2564100 RepID=A0A4U0FC44_9BACL|nr:hypothetical protein [Cohnella pontilimi]TJY40812.1 hypothetical protein E5161_16875 [Cohnella pontilimi]